MENPLYQEVSVRLIKKEVLVDGTLSAIKEVSKSYFRLLAF